MRPFWDKFLNNFTDLLQLFHQVVLRLQTTRGIHDENITTPRRCCLDGIIDDRAWIGTRILAYYWYANALRPHFELVNGCSAECIGSGKHHPVPFSRETIGQFRDGG